MKDPRNSKSDDQPLRLLALETSSVRGSVALLETTRWGASPPALGEPGRAARPSVVAYLRHEQLNQHAERMLPLVEAALSGAGWARSDLDLIAVGVGPGSFTGVRVAVSLAQGLMMGLGVPGVGVGSLRAVAAGLDSSAQWERGHPPDPRVRIVVRDARREEYFLSAYDPDGTERIAPHSIPQEHASGIILDAVHRASIPDGDYVVLGTTLAGLPCEVAEETVEPDARCVGRVAAGLDPRLHPVLPEYVRGPGVVRPVLPPSPFS